MGARRLAGIFLVALAAPAWTAGVTPHPAFDQGIDATKTLESVQRTVREDRSVIAPPVAVAEEAFGFSTGNDFTAVKLYGELSVSCHEAGQSDHAYFRCREEILDPAEFVRFAGPKGVDADRVSLSATWTNGTTREKAKGWDSAKGRSSDYFNLWIATLLQRPLLDYGANAVHYSLTKDGKAVRDGSFTATVRRGEARSCRYRRHYTSYNMSDCRAGSTTLCDRYFREENYCR